MIKSNKYLIAAVVGIGSVLWIWSLFHKDDIGILLGLLIYFTAPVLFLFLIGSVFLVLPRKDKKLSKKELQDRRKKLNYIVLAILLLVFLIFT